MGGASAATTGKLQVYRDADHRRTKNFGEAFVLGDYKQALEAKGFDVSYKENILYMELIQKALTSGKITLYPEYVGIAYTVTFKKRRSRPPPGDVRHGEGLYGKKEEAVLRTTPFRMSTRSPCSAPPRRARPQVGRRPEDFPLPAARGLPRVPTRATGLVGRKKATASPT